QLTTVRRLRWLALDEHNRSPLAHRTMAAAIAGWHPAAVVTATRPDTQLGRYLIDFFGPPTVRIGAMLGWRLAASPVADAPASDRWRPFRPRPRLRRRERPLAAVVRSAMRDEPDVTCESACIDPAGRSGSWQVRMRPGAWLRASLRSPRSSGAASS